MQREPYLAFRRPGHRPSNLLLIPDLVIEHPGTNLVMGNPPLTSTKETSPRTPSPQDMTLVRLSLHFPAGLLTQLTESTTGYTAAPLYRTETMRTFQSTVHHATPANFGGFPGLREIISHLLRRFLPGVHQRLTRTITM